jgi:hypothetical protein
MFCPKCGKEQVDNPAFCRNCGERLRSSEDETNPSAVGYARPPDNNAVRHEEPKERQMMSQRFEGAVYASEDQLNSLWGFFVGQKKTSLEMTDAEVKFKEGNIDINGIRSISLVKERFHWGAALLGIFLFIIFTIFFGGTIAIIIRGLGLGFLIWALIVSRNKWVLIEHSEGKTYFKMPRGKTNELYSALQKYTAK